MKRRWLVCSVVLLSLVLALPASMQTKDVLTNGDFEVDLSEWTQNLGTLAHTTTTTRGGSAGAAQITPDGSSASAYQCVDISGELATWPSDGVVKYITYNGYLLSADGTSPVGLWMIFFSDTSCNSYIAGTGTSVTTASEWTFHTMTQAIPGTAQSIQFWFYNGDAGTGVMYADDLAAFSSTTTAVKTQGMAARNSLWAVGLAGVAAVGVVLTRRKKS